MPTAVCCKRQSTGKSKTCASGWHGAAAGSIVAQGLRAVVVIPLYASARASTDASSTDVRRGDFLGVLYMDSKRPTAFSKLDRQILDALAADAASILDNARLVERERERQRLE